MRRGARRCLHVPLNKAWPRMSACMFANSRSDRARSIFREAFTLFVDSEPQIKPDKFNLGLPNLVLTGKVSRFAVLVHNLFRPCTFHKSVIWQIFINRTRLTGASQYNVLTYGVTTIENVRMMFSIEK